jgi:hypothetical protein
MDKPPSTWWWTTAHWQPGSPSERHRVMLRQVRALTLSKFRQIAQPSLIRQQASLPGTIPSSRLTLAPTIFADNKTTPSSGNIQIRAINASTSLGTADVYAIAPGVDISTVNPTFSALAYQSASSYATLAAGSYQLEFTQAGSKNVLTNSNAISFAAGQIRTIIALDNPSGGFTTAILSDLN